ncbi:Transcriptional regulator, AraC family protein [Minicystis rosea]|nr:Transcriptional regulator, AraC family protein [Minicystis rosea]
MLHDAFSDVLALVGARSAIAGGFVAGGRWAIRFPPPALVKFFIAARGECWLQVDGEAAPARLREGEVFLLAAPRSFRLASALDVPPRAASELFSGAASDIPRIGEGDTFLFFGGHVSFEDAQAPLIIESLPPVLHLPAGGAEAGTLQTLIHLLLEEHRATRPGASFAATQIAQLMFLQILRACAAETGPGISGRLRILADRRLAPALQHMHAEPGRAWQLDELARLAGMSRTAFAVHFKAVAGVAPLAYLTEWRMRLAQRELDRTNTSFAELAATLGYASESAFSTAFKRVTGLSPKHYRAKARHARTGA